MVVRCYTDDDVRSGLARAEQAGLPVSVLGGGHDWLGRSVRPGGVVLDLSGMREVTVEGDTVVVGGGVTAMEATVAVEKAGRSLAVGAVGAIGMAGYTLAGGYGSFLGIAGLAVDNLIAADVVLADGKLVHAGEDGDADLLWALRGGGGNFGVVTSMRVRSHPIETVLAGTIAFGWDQAADVLAGFDALSAEAPDELTSRIALATLPDGQHVAVLVPTWAGEPGAGKDWMRRLEGLGRPVLAESGVRMISDVLRAGDVQFSEPVQDYDWATRSVAGFTPEVIETLIEGMNDRTSPLSAVNMHQFHGAATRVPVAATAFAERRPHIMLELLSSWRPGDGTTDQGWSAEMRRRLEPYALPGGYPNMLAPTHTDQVARAYGPNTERLLDLKRAYDPTGTFSATPLPSEIPAA